VKLPLETVLFVKKEESLPQIVSVQMDTMMMDLVPLVESVISIAPPASDHLTIVLLVLKTESEPQIVTVLSLMDIMKLTDKLTAHLVDTDVPPALLNTNVLLVLKVELTHQLVTVQPENSKMLT